jgi:hypothetical protein
MHKPHTAQKKKRRRTVFLPEKRKRNRAGLLFEL